MEMLEVKLVKDSQGLGITIVGYVAGGGAPGKSYHFHNYLSL